MVIKPDGWLKSTMGPLIVVVNVVVPATGLVSMGWDC